jgi:hypothetical protein
MGYALVRYRTAIENGRSLFEQLEERLLERSLTHYASWLLDRGLKDQQALEKALDKAMSVLCSARMACHHHFKKIYVSQQGQLKTDWLVSDLGMRMIIMQADTNPAVASLQVQLLSTSQPLL